MMKPTLILWFALLASVQLSAQEPLAYASGSWYNPDRNGEGFVVQLLSEGRAVVTWFTYPPEGEDSEQAWMIGTGNTEDKRIVITEMLRPMGATFGPEFDPETVVRKDWGNLEITFADCDSANATWAGPPDFGSGSMDLTRLSAIDDVECDPETASEPDRVIAGRSGPWYDPGHDGEGWMLEMLGDGRMVVYWFTYDDQGRQAWMIGEARVEGRTFWVEDLFITRGTRFGDAFRKEDVVLDHWGSFGFLFEDYKQAKMRYASTDERFGEGTLTPFQLAQLSATDCAEPPPIEPLTAGSWHLSTDTDVAFTETASAGAGGFIYTGGGIGHFSRFQRFDPASESYSELSNLPAQRHHPMMASDGHNLYMAGGYISRMANENAGNNFWRFNPDGGEWEILPDLPKARAAGAAVYMLGRIWVMGGIGTGSEMQSYDIRTGEWALFPSAQGMIFDHMQAVAFENELWWMGGRTNATFNRVKIWNPVSREWREGPPMFFPRAGFAAGVVRGQIMVAGGERLDGMTLIDSMEVFAPGADGWVPGPAPPIAVHGTTGAVVDGTFLFTTRPNTSKKLSRRL